MSNNQQREPDFSPSSPQSHTQTDESLVFTENSNDVKGKQRETEFVNLYEATYGDDDEETVTAVEETSTFDQGVYPPMHDQELEERRVIETLKRWEEADRLRRKAARDRERDSKHSANSVQTLGSNNLGRSGGNSALASSLSVVSDVSRRATKYWNKSNAAYKPRWKGAVRLNQHDSVDEDLPSSSSSSNMPLENPSSPTPLIPEGHVSTNPFASPSHGPLDGGGALMEGSSVPPTPAAIADNNSEPNIILSPSPERPAILHASSSYSSTAPFSSDALQSDPSPPLARSSNPKIAIPPPLPLDLPEVVTPPPPIPRVMTPNIDRSEIELWEEEEEQERERKQGRWWTDWFCGCRESGRLGDGQAGRTNPFE